MSGGIFLHFGHLGSTDAAFFLATLVYVPVTAIALVAAMEAAAGRRIRLAQRFTARYERTEPAIKAAAFLMVVSSGVDLGYVPGHVSVEPVAAALFGLDAAALLASSLLVVTRPELRPAAVILLVAGMLAYAMGGVQLDVTVLIAKVVETLALLVLMTALVRGRGGPEPEVPTADQAIPLDTGTGAGRGAHRVRRGRGGRAPGRRARRP